MEEDLSRTPRDWLERAAKGDDETWRQLLAQYHDRLRRMVVVRLDPRLQGRVDPSDVLQEAYLEAAQQLEEYLRNPTVPFFLWLRLLAAHRLGRAHRFHLGAQQRDIGREVSLEGAAGSDVSSEVLAACLLGGADRPSELVAGRELHDRLQALLERLGAADREILALRHFEQLSTAETAQVLGISTAAAGKRYVRALTRLRALLAEDPDALEGWQL
jgi:RNA polymerase sigma-70 factor (ECF subfamily)